MKKSTKRRVSERHVNEQASFAKLADHFEAIDRALSRINHFEAIDRALSRINHHTAGQARVQLMTAKLRAIGAIVTYEAAKSAAKRGA